MQRGAGLHRLEKESMGKAGQIAILGRPNVGKSTLFNRLCKRRRALVGREPGMTRDRLYGTAEWGGKHYEIVDTGGMMPGDKDLIAGEIFRHAQMAIKGASHLLLVVDGRQDLVPVDEELALLLRRTGKPVSVAVNKVDSPQHLGRVAPFYRLGIKSVFGISAEHGLGVDELLDHFAEEIPEAAEESTYDVTQVAIIGRPNVGKSTLLNQLVKEERSIVSVLPGTTRDAIDAEFRQGDDRFRLIDTAGIRRKGKTKLLAEKLSVIMARKHLEASDVALLLLDASDGVSALDSRIGGYAHESGRSVILVVNKWDAVKRGPSTTVDYTKYLRRRLKYLDYAPVIFLSALTGRHVGKLGGLMVEVARERLRRLSPAELETFVEEVDWDRVRSPRKNKGQVHRVTQAGGAPPSFFLHTGGGAKLHYAFERFVENRLRERFGFLGAPILIRAKRGR